MSRRNISLNTPLEKSIGFSRAVRIGSNIAVSGTAPIHDGQTISPGDAYAQTKYCLQLSLDAIKQAGGALQDVIRTRVMLTDINNWQEAAKAHGELFGDIQPACTFVEVSGFIDPQWLIETEMDAVVTNQRCC